MIKIKVCGITTAEDAQQTVALGVDALGFVFAPSPRRIKPATAAEIIRGLPPFVATVGVFVNEEQKVVHQIFAECRLSIVQLHGAEDQQYLTTLGLPLIKAFRVADDQVLKQIQQFDLSHFLLDTFIRDTSGGTGKTFNWDIACQAKKYGRVILSGGLNPNNIRRALTTVGPCAVDVSSGVESVPGRKDIQKLTDFVNEVRNWDSQTNKVISVDTAAASSRKH